MYRVRLTKKSVMVLDIDVAMSEEEAKAIAVDFANNGGSAQFVYEIVKEFEPEGYTAAWVKESPNV